ncbi:hypothetical protein EV644_102648 [Kribbella orskensis]|uniref:ABC-2 type transport system permease protein n=1 Tax=Kribbella orskensis TaxID=2512216 RepID=A0ABY2BTH1_9ACTN|nr:MULTISPECIES: DUF6297 family protein [Kribbella]TCN42717.1 hypothetical protein EV642_10289 [Kribbella sp. VKM Ac-2500]TCO29927.1 hypothetical protein EV644_102648 [Kribbella orskensis]
MSTADPVDGPVVFDPADFGAIPTSKELRRWMRKVRRGKADRSVWQQFEDIYLVIFALAMLGATGGNVVLNLNDRSAGCTTASCGWLLDTVPLILVPLLVSGMLRVLLSIGPVSASRATGFWLLATPVDRASLLRPSYRLVMVGAVVVGALAAVVGWALFGTNWSTVGEAAVLTTVVLLCTACVTVWAQQTAARSRRALWVADGLLVLAAVPALLLAIRPREEAAVTSTLVDLNNGSAQIRLVVISAIAVLVAVALVVFTSRTLNNLSRQSVVAGGELLAGIAGAAITLDVSLLADVVAGRHWRQVGRVKSRRGRGSRGVAMIHREFVRVLRWPRRLVIGFALLVVPYAVAGTGYDVLVPIAAGLAGFIAVRPLMDGLRSVCRSIGLVRALGMDLRELRVIMSVAPGAFAALWAALATPALGSPAVAFAVAAGMLTGAVRQASARPPSYSGPLVASPMGAIPPGLFSTPIRGFDLLLVCLAPVLLGLSDTWVLVIPSIVLLILFSVKPKQN